MEAVGTALFIIYIGFNTINWFVLQAYRMKLKLQKTPVSQAQAERSLLHIRLMYFWLQSDYYTSRMAESYYLAYNSPEVNSETVEGLRKSMSRRLVRGLPKVQKKRVV